MPQLFHRGPSGQLSSAAEKLNVQHTNQLLDELFRSRSALGKKAFEQLNGLYATNDHFGRNVRLGMSAAEASKAVDRAQK